MTEILYDRSIEGRARLLVVILLSLCLLSAGMVSAQTSTPTATITPTPTLTPDVHQYWTPPTIVVSGVPQSAQGFAFSHTADAGDVATTFFRAAIFFSLVVMALIWVFNERRGK